MGEHIYNMLKQSYHTPCTGEKKKKGKHISYNVKCSNRGKNISNTALLINRFNITLQVDKNREKPAAYTVKSIKKRHKGKQLNEKN